MRKFEKPELELWQLDEVDMICTSGLVDDGIIDGTSSNTPFIPLG